MVKSNPKSSKEEKPQQAKLREPAIPFSQLYRYSTKFDYFLMTIGTITSIATGAIMPCSILLFGNVANQINPNELDAFVGVAKDYCGYYFALAGGGFIVAFIGMSSWMLVGERQTLNLRKNYFRAILKQEIGYFDTVNPSEFATKTANDSQMILMGIGEKVFTFISSISLITAGYVVGFAKGWKLSVVMLAALPVMFLGCFLYIFAMQKTNKVQIESYEKSGGIAEQALAAIKTVTALGGEEKEVKAYKKALDDSRFKVVIYGFLSGLCIGLMLFGTFFSYFLGLWYGARLIQDDTWNTNLGRPYSFGDVLTIFLAMMIGSGGFMGATTPLKSFVNAKLAGARVMAIVDRPSKINVEDPSGEKPNFRGKIEYKNVQFAYPTKPDKQILKGINLTANIGQKIAFVGESGCGKTTALQLIERFYDTDAGEVLIDGVPIKSINIRWLRQNIGYVGQEPALFACSVRDNMRFAKKDATDEEIWNALKAVNMDVFIKGLSKQLDTNVGAGGGQISGGQKQRLAIARAVLKNPSILLLDEATSALDRKNEVEIQATLDHVSKERTTIVIAHRLSTIQNADLILVFDKGIIAERGTHEELLNNKGLYYNLIKHQINQLETDEKKKKQQEKKQQEKEILFPQSNQIELRVDQPIQSEINELKAKPIRSNSRTEHNINFLTADQRNNLKAFRHPGDEEVEKEEENSANRQHSILEDIPVQMEVLSNQRDVFNLGGAVVAASYMPVNEVHDIKHNEPDSPANSDTKSDTRPKKKEYSLLEVVTRLTNYGKGARFVLYLTYFMPMLNGTAMTCSGILLAEMMEILSDPSAPNLHSRSDFVTMWFLIMGAIVIVILFVERGVQAIISERITTAVRVDVFQKLVRMHMGFFDDPMNSSGALSGRLASDATQVNALLTNAGNLTLGGFGALLTGIIMAFVGDWRLALVGLGLVPLLLMGGKFNAQVNKRLSAAQDDAYVEANGYLAEILNNMRTIVSFSEEEEFRRIYDQKLAEPAKEFKERSVMSGAAYGYFYFMMTCSFGIFFVVGAYIMRDHGLGIKGLFLVIMGITSGTRTAGNAMDAIPEAGNAVTGAAGLFRLLDAESEIDINDEAGKITKPIEGNFEFENVSFKYPTRDQYVLRDFNLKINAGNKIAFVGSSGCGKSTVVQLIMRFYNPVKGTILLDGIPIQNYNLKHLRRYLSIVSQEPVLFNGTIEENIKYSCENATDDEVREAAKQANALRFIENNEFDDIVPGAKNQNFGTGFQRKVGPKGSQMSGGQKQRIAIARAIIKKPRILLLDEATSALDSQSEAVVQESLDKIMQGKTSIAIAHRISTIRDANEILLFDRGVVAERGTYEALVKAEGMFYKLEKGI